MLNIKYILTSSKIYFFIFFVVFFSIFTLKANALTLDNTIYISGDPITITDDGGAFIVFNGTGDPVGGDYSYSSGLVLNTTSPYARGDYKIIEFNYFDECFYESRSYDQCSQSPEVVAQVFFTVIPSPVWTDNGADTDASPPVLDPELAPAGVSSSYTSYPPEVNIFSIFKGSLFSDNLIIDYKASDQNDSPGDPKSGSHGLSLNPVSISYSDKIGEWYNSFINSNDIVEIAKDQPKEGKYKWSVKDLIPGSLYRIIVQAVDLSGLLGQAVSELFGVDFTPPVFTVKVAPEAVRSGKVTITVDSSEDLKDVPEVSILQNGGELKKIIMTGDKSHYEGIYEVTSGFDGTAFVKVSGLDLAGNVGTVIVSGGTFSVGVNPPPKPTINNYKEKVVTNVPYIDISGKTRADTVVVLSVNGIEIQRLNPDINGNFTLPKIKLEKTKNSGLNYVSIVAIDKLGSQSESSLIQVKYNIAPVVKITKPLVKEVLDNITTISAVGSDENNDTLFYSYQLISQSDFNNKVNNWVNLSENNPSSNFSWNTTEVSDGKYLLKVIASDGIIKTESEVVTVSVKNVLPFFRFEDGRNTITNLSSVSIKGKAITSENLSPRPDIVSVAYSMDAGNTWTPVKLISAGSVSEKKFLVEFSDLKEGIYPILWRTKDSRGYIGKIVHSIIVDKTAPKEPIITSLKQDKVIIINDSSDENPVKSGVQLNIKGTTEGTSVVSLIYAGKTITSKSLPTGAFIFSDITFDKKGKYDLSIYSTDQAGNKSPFRTFSIIYNNPPIISFINPKPFGGLSGKVDLSWSVKDTDNDIISSVKVSYRNKEKDTEWKDLLLNANPVGTYSFNTLNLPESNNYELKISAKDTYSDVSSSESFSVDNTPPLLLSFVFDVNPESITDENISLICRGESSDNLSGVEYVEYTIEDSNGKTSPWYKGLITSGFLKNKSAFIIKHPTINEDGDYKVHARSVDRAGNVSSVSTLFFHLDKTAPRIGGFFLKKNNINISPDENGAISIYKNSIFNFNISLENDTSSATLKVGDDIFTLVKNDTSGLWSSDLFITKESREKILISVVDTKGNKVIDKYIGDIVVSPRGVVSMIKDGSRNLIEGSSVKVMKLNNSTNQYDDFNALGIDGSTVESNKSGEYDLILPEGEYRFTISGPDLSTEKHNLQLSRPSIVNLNFEMSPISSFRRFINNFLEIFK